jgi:hypothetical protein
VVVLAATVVSLSSSGRAGGQTPPVTPFPRDLMAFVPAERVEAAAAVDPSLATQSVAVATGDGVGANRVVTVWFASPVTLPDDDYRVSVVVEAPDGTQTRASFHAADGQPTGGSVETSTDGRRWTDAGATPATIDGAALQITAPVAEPTAAGGTLRLDAQLGSDEAERSTSPAFSLDALLGRHEGGALPATTVGMVVPAPDATSTAAPDVPPMAEPVALPGPPPTLTVDSNLTVTETAPVPATLAGRAVVNAIDEITFMPGYTADGTAPAVVQINRTTGAVAALTGTSGLPVDRTGDGSFVTEGLTVDPAKPPSPDAPARVVLDLAAVTEALDLPVDPAGLGIGLRRKLTLDDGRDVVGVPTMATLVWYETASPTPAPGPEQAAPATEDESDAAASSSGAATALAVGLAVVAVAAIALVVGAMVRRRRAAAIDQWLHDDQDPDPDPDPPMPRPASRSAPTTASPAATRPPPATTAAATATPEPEPEPRPSSPSEGPTDAAELQTDADRPDASIDPTDPTDPTGTDHTADPDHTAGTDHPADPDDTADPADPDDPADTDHTADPDDAAHPPDGEAGADHDESTTASTEPPDSPPDPTEEATGTTRSPADALAMFEAEVDALTQRVDRLPDVDA